MRERSIETRRGLKSRVRELGSGAPLLFLHGAGGLARAEPLLERLAERFQVFAPEWPGYGSEGGEEKLEDMLDFALHGWDLVEELELERPHLLGHSMGGMIAAEMACVANRSLGKLALIAPLGLWLDAHPLPDLFTLLPFEWAAVLFADPASGEKFLGGGVDFSNPAALQQFLIANARRLGTASRILFPIPDRQLAKRLYRLRAPTLLVWGAQDRLIPAVYAERWRELVPHARLALFEGAGHMVGHEQSEAVAAELQRFLVS
jgi:pimeloyl-ACP methyl ester carboxylesterase